MGRTKEVIDRLVYKWSWLRFRVSYKTRLAWHWFTRDLCWHLTKGGMFKRCVVCWLKHEMKQMLKEEIEKAILYGDGS